MRLTPPRFAGGEPFGRKPKTLLKRHLVLQARAVIGRERHDQRALAPQVNALSTRGFEFRRKGRPQRLAGAVSANSGSSPGSTSAEAASMPAAARLAPCPAVSRSNTV